MPQHQDLRMTRRTLLLQLSTALPGCAEAETAAHNQTAMAHRLDRSQTRAAKTEALQAASVGHEPEIEVTGLGLQPPKVLATYLALNSRLETDLAKVAPLLKPVAPLAQHRVAQKVQGRSETKHDGT
jgi:hypothetical protein